MKDGYVFQDIHRNFTNVTILTHLYRCFVNPSYRIIWLFRLLHLGGNNLIYKVLHLYYTRYANKYSIILHPSTKIGAGLQFPHNGPIVINAAAVIGENCIIHPCTLIGGDRKTGTPIIGNNVFIGHGSKIIGKISIGNDVFIAPGAILTKDVDDNYIVGSGVNNIIRKTGGKDAYNRYSANKKDYNNS